MTKWENSRPPGALGFGGAASVEMSEATNLGDPDSVGATGGGAPAAGVVVLVAVLVGEESGVGMSAKPTLRSSQSKIVTTLSQTIPPITQRVSSNFHSVSLTILLHILPP